MIPGGRLGDLRDHRRMVVDGLAVFGGAPLVCGLSFSYGLLVGFRAVQGLGAAALFTVSVAAISNAVARDHRAVAIGLLSESRYWDRIRPIHRRTSDRVAQLAGVLPQRPAQCDRNLLLPSMVALDATRGGDGADRLAGIDPRQLRYCRGGVRRRYQGVVRLVSVLSLVGGAVLLAIALIGRRITRPSEATSPAS